MKALLRFFAIVALLSTTSGLTAQPAVDPLQNPELFSQRAEAPRYGLVPYQKKELAMAADPSTSSYIEPLSGSWRVKNYTPYTDIDTLLTAPQSSTASWSEIKVPQSAPLSGWAAIYRTEFKVPFAWIDRQVFVHMGAVSRAYYVYVNGRKVGYHEDSKVPAEFDITAYVSEGKNHIAVVAYAEPLSLELENHQRTQGTSIEGECYVFAQPRVRMRDYVVDGAFAPDGTTGLLSLGVVVKSHLLNPKQVTLYYDMYAPDGELVRSGKRDARFDMRREDTVRFFENIPRIESWSHESPKLYTIALRLQHEGRFTEYNTIQVGFRQIAYSKEGLTLNGRPIDLRAVNYTPARSEGQLIKDLERFKSQGVNLLRVENFPQHNNFYSLCDRYGIYVCDQANLDTRLSGESLEVGGTIANDTLWARAISDRVMNMYYRSKNHPSVIIFSLGDQVGRGYGMYEAYLRLKEVEPTRPIIYGGAGAEWNSDMLVGVPAGKHPSDERYTLLFESSDRYANATPARVAPAILESQPNRGRALLTNPYKLTNLVNFQVGYEIIQRKQVVAQGEIDADVAPGGRATISAPIEELAPGKYTLRFYVAHRESTPWCEAGERLSEESFPLVIPKPAKK